MRCVCQLCGAGVFLQMTGFPIIVVTHGSKRGHACPVAAGMALAFLLGKNFHWLGSLVVGAVLDELFGMMESFNFLCVRSRISQLAKDFGSLSVGI